MTHQASALELMLRGLSVGALFATAFGMWRSPVTRNAKIATTLFCLAAAGYVLDAYGVARQVLGVAHPVCWLLDAGVPGVVWMMILVVFEDRKVSARPRYGGGSDALDAYGCFAGGGPLNWTFVTCDVISVVLAIHPHLGPALARTGQRIDGALGVRS